MSVLGSSRWPFAALLSWNTSTHHLIYQSLQRLQRSQRDHHQTCQALSQCPLVGSGNDSASSWPWMVSAVSCPADAQLQLLLSRIGSWHWKFDCPSSACGTCGEQGAGSTSFEDVRWFTSPLAAPLLVFVAFFKTTKWDIGGWGSSFSTRLPCCLCIQSGYGYPCCLYSTYVLHNIPRIAGISNAIIFSSADQDKKVPLFSLFLRKGFRFLWSSLLCFQENITFQIW